MRGGSAEQGTADDLLHDLGRPAVDGLDAAVGEGPGDGVLASCSRSRRAVGGSGRRPASAARSPTTWPWRRARRRARPSAWSSMQRSRKVRVTAHSVAISAISKRMCCLVASGRPNASRSLTYSVVISRRCSAAAIAGDGDAQALLREVRHQVDEGAVAARRGGSPSARDVVEEQLGGVLGLLADLVEVAAALEAVRAALDDQQATGRGRRPPGSSSRPRSPGRRGCRWR